MMSENITPSHPEPAIFVIFGVTGNLAQHRLLPALYHLLKDNLLNPDTVIVGVSRKSLSVDALLSKVELCVLEDNKVCDPAVLQKFRKQLLTVQLDPVQAESYEHLSKTLDDIEDKHGLCMNRLIYLSIPPQVYEPVIKNLGLHRINEGCQHHRAVSRLLVEKPFGYDLTSATDLIANTAKYFTEEQVFRIDHYLAKETVQNILIFRNQNPVFASIWNREHVTAIDLQLSEQIGVQGRVEFYDNVGALRDVVQNHLMQLLTLVTMEPLQAITSKSLHEAKELLLSRVQTIDPEIDRTIRGQYAGYAEEVINPGSTTETYASIALRINNDRWRDVPVTLTAGKALDAKRTAIEISFANRDQPEKMNRLTFRIQPEEGIGILLTVKQPGFSRSTEPVLMDFSYAHAFGDPTHPDAYERVLIDAAKGDHSLFATSDEVLESWRIIQPVLHAWASNADDLHPYEPGSNGPEA